jgi:hypothetical protein
MQIFYFNQKYIRERKRFHFSQNQSTNGNITLQLELPIIQNNFRSQKITSHTPMHSKYTLYDYALKNLDFSNEDNEN